MTFDILIITGGIDDDGKTRDEIYQLDTETNTWVEVGRMKRARESHGLSTIEFRDVAQLCQ